MKRATFDICYAPIILAILCTSLLYHHSFFTFDTWWHISLGREIYNSANLHKETLAFTTNAVEVRNHSWLCDVIFAYLDKTYGDVGLELLCAVVVLLTLLGLYYNARSLGAHPLVALAACIVFIFSSLLLLHLRPQIFTYLLFSWLTLAVNFLKGYLRILFVIIIFALWVNLHAAFIVGIAYLAVLVCAEAFDAFLNKASFSRVYSLISVLFVACLCILIHPDGIYNVLNVLAHDPLALGINKIVNEWQPASRSLVTPFYEIVFLGALLCLFVKPLPRARESIPYFAFSLLGISAWRHIPLFGVVGLPILAGWISSIVRQVISYRQLGKNTISVAQNIPISILRVSLSSIAISILSVIFWKEVIFANETVEQRRIEALQIFPIEASQWISQNQPCGNMFNLFEWGGYLGYTLQHSYLVFIDSRIQPFTGKPISDYSQVIDAKEGWQRTLSEYKIGFAVLRPDSTLSVALSRLPEWKVGFQSDREIIYVNQLCKS